MQVVLVMFRADGERRSFSIARDVTVIGRRDDCDLRIPLGDVSRKHCRIVKEAEGVRIEDLGSSNGTYHNGQRVQEGYLSPGDQVQIGSVIFITQIDGVPAEEEMAPVAGQPMPAGDAASEGDALQELDEVEPSEGAAEEEATDESLAELDPMHEVDPLTALAAEVAGSQPTEEPAAGHEADEPPTEEPGLVELEDLEDQSDEHA